MKKLLVTLFVSQHPVLVEGALNANIENGNFAFTKPYLMSVSYARSAEDKNLFALAITVEEQDNDRNGLVISTAL